MPGFGPMTEGCDPSMIRVFLGYKVNNFIKNFVESLHKALFRGM
jgi:hypothetical protein